MKIICSYSFGVHTHLTEKKMTNFITHEIAEMKLCKSLIRNNIFRNLTGT